MTTLAEFLFECIAEDHAAATEAAHRESGRWATGGDASTRAVEDAEGNPVIYDEGSPSYAQAAHITRWDPARVLAECEAKREIIKRETAGRQMRFDDRYGHAVFDGLTLQSTTDSTVLVDSVNGYPVYDAEQTRELLDRYSEPITDTPVLRLLAVPYAGRPGYQPEWRP